MSAETGRKKGSNEVVPSNGWEPAPLPRTGGAPKRTGTNIKRHTCIVNAAWGQQCVFCHWHAEDFPHRSDSFRFLRSFCRAYEAVGMPRARAASNKVRPRLKGPSPISR